MTPTAAVRSILGDQSGTLSEARCREVVVAVLRACREPTGGMVWAYELPHIGPEEVAEVYRAMIDALIEEVSGE